MSPAASKTFCSEQAMIIEGIFNSSWDGMKQTSAMRKDFNSTFNSILRSTGLELSVLSQSCLYSDMG